MIQPAEIARLAHRLGLGDKTIEKDYALTWTLFVHYILAHDLADARAVSYRIDEKMARNKVDRSELGDVLARKQETLRRLWEPRLQGQMEDLPHLDTVIRETNRWLRQAGLVGE